MVSWPTQYKKSAVEMEKGAKEVLSVIERASVAILDETINHRFINPRLLRMGILSCPSRYCSDDDGHILLTRHFSRKNVRL
jgi:hypothetical protein